MFSFLKRRLLVAEGDGIKFYSECALKNYLREKQTKESRKGKHLYTFEIPWWQKADVGRAKVILEEGGCFDYSVQHEGSFYRIQYWSEVILLRWKDEN
jgi:hypothetical protein